MPAHQHFTNVPCLCISMLLRLCFNNFFFFSSLLFVPKAVRLKEKSVASEIVAVSCGPKQCQVMGVCLSSMAMSGGEE